MNNDEAQEEWTTIAPLPSGEVMSKMSDWKIMEEADFLALMRQSIDNQQPLDLSGFLVDLTKGAIRLRGREQLEIHGGRIQGAIHSLFQIDGDKKNNPRRLTLRGCTLAHLKEDEDPRQIGAAVFAMGSCVVVLENCDISSKGGFAVWGKHRCSITLSDCRIHDVARTAVACFNSVNVTIQKTSIRAVGIHGICGRGTSVVTVQNAVIDGCQVRAVMVYQGASMDMEDVAISNTHDPTTPTIHVQGPSLDNEEDEDKSEKAAEDKSKGTVNNANSLIPSLKMKRCKVTHSAGPPLSFEGQAHQDLIDNQLLS